MVLVTICEVCTTPKKWRKEDELILLNSTLVICPLCKKPSKITNELKDDILRHLRTLYHEEP